MSLFLSERNNPWFIPTNPNECGQIGTASLNEKKVVEFVRGEFNFAPGEIVFIYTSGRLQRITHKLFAHPQQA